MKQVPVEMVCQATLTHPKADIGSFVAQVLATSSIVSKETLKRTNLYAAQTFGFYRIHDGIGIPYPLLRQGDLPRAELVHRFKEARNAVLFGVKTFWEGIDIPGDALSLVVIDRLPFDPPDDPVHEARVTRMKARGENWFRDYILPQAVLYLKQGVGRLLRTDYDRGVMAILDTRLHTRGYGKSILLALPPAPRIMALKDVERFFTQIERLSSR